MTPNEIDFSHVSRQVLLFGELLFDCFAEREIPGGAPFNVAHHLLGLGGEMGIVPMLISRVGDDERGRRLLSVLHAAGLATSGVEQDSEHATGAVLVSEQPSGTHRFEIPADQAWDFIQADIRMESVDPAAHWFYFGTLAQRADSHRALAATMQSLRTRGFLDTNLRDPWVREDVLRWSLQHAEVAKLNSEELVRMAALFGYGNGLPRQHGERLIQDFAIHQLLVTDGEPGAWLLTAAGEYAHTSSEASKGTKITVVDTVGAGDAFAAVFLMGLILGWPTQQILDRAHSFAVGICGIRGAVPARRDFYEPYVAAWQLAGEQVL